MSIGTEPALTRIAVIGAGGRMGRALVRAVTEAPSTRLAVAVARSTSADLGKDAGLLAGVGALGVQLRSDLPSAGDTDVWIDASSPDASVAVAQAASRAGARLLVATTGLSEEGKAALATLARQIPLVLAPTTSVGLTLLLQLVADAARALGPAYDMEIVEAHHRGKRDAPSGTALRLAEALAEGSGRDLARTARYARQGDIGPRDAEEIGIQTIRGGDVVGDHTVHFLGNGDRIEITHRASSRETFARGAMRAALWLAEHGRAPGLYDMRDVLGLR